MAGSQLGDWIRHRRSAQGLSQRALADRSGLSRSYLCDIERGRGSHPSLETFDKLAAALGASREDLLTASGVLDSPATRGNAAERRLVAIFRDLTPGGREALERFARFTHAEEHRWVQARLIDEEPGLPLAAPGEPLFPLDPVPDGTDQR